MSRRRKILNDLMECKAQGICARDTLTTEYMTGVFKWQLQMRQVAMEAARDRLDLPPCPPDCNKPTEVIEHER